MLLHEAGIKEFVEKMKNEKVNIDHIHLKCNPNKPFALITGDATSGIVQDDEYYINFYENIIASQYSCLDPISKLFKTQTEMTFPVLPDGNFKQDQIETVISIEIPHEERNLEGFLMKRIKSFVIFHSYIKSVQIIGHRGKIRNIYFNLVINGNLVAKTIRDKDNFNKQILLQWLYQIQKCYRDNRNQERFDNTFKVINGKINYEGNFKKIFQYFKLNKKVFADEDKEL